MATSGLARDWHVVHAPVRDAIDRLRARNAARRIVHGIKLTHIAYPLAEVDDQRLRVNVFSLVAPGLVTWR